ncbi:mycosin-1 [Mycobacteroides chelonae]|uniref:type VII secretion-associated serine protease mycosin n=1 Tax=Mycobacteroides chelonae TaxID=1774 RepID=UPI0021DB9B97|nr:type VII secretion-associated serine protease mycosin [Mycobacteroides chelonae]GLE59043.1 mycosin-1 [Mycobacteroides chelonae]
MSWSRRAGALAAVSSLTFCVPILPAPMAWAMEPPKIPANPQIPGDPPAAPDQPMRFNEQKPCALPGVLPTPPVGDVPQAQVMLGLEEAHKSATGAGVKVAVIDTGVARNPRIDVEPGGDYIVAADNGLVDCDMHGTLVASIIAGKPDPADPFVGMAPDAQIISIRQSSGHWSPENPPRSLNPQQEETAGKIETLAAALVKAVNLGARVVNMSVVSCVAVARPIDQAKLAIAIWYAAVIKDAVLVAAAGNVGGDNPGCQQNPGYDPVTPGDPNIPGSERNWEHVVVESLPSAYSDYVIGVASVDDNGSAPEARNAAQFSMNGPWVSLAAPGVNIVALGPDGKPINALPGQNGLVNIYGTSFSAAYVSGLAAQLRSDPRYKDYSAAQIRRRMQLTAHAGPRGVDNAIGYGLIDPVAALNWTFQDGPGPSKIVESHREKVIVTPPPLPPTKAPHQWALLISAVVMAAGLGGRQLWKIWNQSRRSEKSKGAH